MSTPTILASSTPNIDYIIGKNANVISRVTTLSVTPQIDIFYTSTNQYLYFEANFSIYLCDLENNTEIGSLFKFDGTEPSNKNGIIPYTMTLIDINGIKHIVDLENIQHVSTSTSLIIYITNFFPKNVNISEVELRPNIIEYKIYDCHKQDLLSQYLTKYSIIHNSDNFLFIEYYSNYYYVVRD
eukprot:Pgem_evm1s9202